MNLPISRVCQWATTCALTIAMTLAFSPNSDARKPAAGLAGIGVAKKKPVKPPSKKELKRRRLVNAGEYLFHREKNYKEASKVLSKAYKLDKKDVKVGLFVVNAKLRAGDQKGAEKFLKKVAKANKTSVQVWSALGQLQLKRGATDKAVASFQKALELNPKYAHGHRKLYDYYLSKAVKGDSSVLKKLVVHLRGYLKHTRYTRGSHYARAERLLAKFEGGDLGLTIHDGKVAYRRAWNDRRSINRQMKTAYAKFQKCLELKPDHELCHLYTGLIQSSVKASGFYDVAKAKDSFRKAPNVVRAWVELGIILRKEDDTSGAEKAFKKAIAIAPRADRGQRALVELGILHKLNGKDKLAVASFEKAYKLQRYSSLASRALNELASVNPEHSLVIAAFRYGRLKGTIFSTEKYKGAMKMLEARFGGVDPNAPEKVVLDEIMARIVAHADIPADSKLNVQVLNTKVVNAFAAPNGNIYFTKGFFDFVRKTYPKREINADHDVVAHVMAHEITHVIRRHTLRSRVYREAAKDAKAHLSPRILTHVTRLHEIEADREGIVLAFLAGYHPRGGIEFMEARGKEREIPKHLSHPTYDERIHFLEEYWTNDVKYAWMSFKFGLDAMEDARKAESSGSDRQAVKHYKEAVSHFQRFKATLKSQKEVGNNLGIGYAKLGVLALAKSKISALNRWQTSFSVEKDLALAYKNLKGEQRTRSLEARKVAIPHELKKARRIFKQTLQKFPNYSRARFNLAVVHVAVGDYDKAKTELSKISGVPAGDIAIMRGVIEAELKNYSAALDHFAKASAGDTARASAYNTALALALSGNKVKAKAAYQAYIAANPSGAWTEAAKKALAEL